MTTKRHKMPHDDRCERRGNILLGLLLLSFGSLLGTQFLVMSTTESRLTSRTTGAVVALAAAEAGVQQALWEYNHAAAWTEFTGWGPPTPALAAGECPVGLACKKRLLTMGTATATVIVQGWNQATPLIVSTGQSPSGVRTRLQVAVQRASLPPVFDNAAFGVGQTQSIGVRVINDGTIDSYNATLGPYGGVIPSDPIYGTLNRTQNGVSATYRAPIRTNSAKLIDSVNPWNGAAIVVGNGSGGGTVGVYGSAQYAPGGAVYNPQNRIYGAPIETIAPKSFLPVALPPRPNTATCPDLGTVSVATDTTYPGSCNVASGITVGAGGNLRFPNLDTLYVDNTFAVTNGGVVNVGQGLVRAGTLQVTQNGSAFQGTTGQVDIYIDGPAGMWQGMLVDANATVKGAGALPKNLRLYSTGDVNVLNGASFYGVTYAPAAGGGMWGSGVAGDPEPHFYGALIADFIDFQGWCHLHYDESLKTETASSPRWMYLGASQPFMTVTSWTRTDQGL